MVPTATDTLPAPPADVLPGDVLSVDPAGLDGAGLAAHIAVLGALLRSVQSALVRATAVAATRRLPASLGDRNPTSTLTGTGGLGHGDAVRIAQVARL
ncbi:MAG: hypothetical protein MUE34_03280, partial [Acidimicrobiales bacterium]|nr:hypothetical protein [Acidimicrobiales bacterium]